MKKSLIILVFILNFLTLHSSWKKVNTPEVYGNLKCVKLDNGLIVGYKSHFIFKSWDNGKTFQRYFIVLDSDTIRFPIKELITIENKIIIHFREFLQSPKIQLIISDDDGDSWKDITPIYNTRYEYLTKENKSLYIYSIRPSGLLKSDDYGKNWDFIKDGERPLDYHRSFSFGDTIILVQNSGDAGNFTVKGPMFSFDNGINWQERPNGLPETGIRNIGKIGDVLLVATRHGVFKSTNFGQVWFGSNNGLKSSFLYNIIVIDDIAYINTENGVYKSVDTAKTWQLVNDIFDGANCTYLEYTNNTFLTYFSKNKWKERLSMFSEDNFETLDTLGFKSSVSIYDMIFEDYVYLGTNNEGIYKTEKMGTEYEFVSPFFKEHRDAISNLYKKDNYLIARFGSQLQFYYNYNDLIFSEDNGLTWRFLEFDEFDINRVIGLIIDDDNSINVLTSNNGIFTSKNNGNTFEKLEISNQKYSGLINNLSSNGTSRMFIQQDSIYICSNNSIIKTDKKFSDFEEILYLDSSSTIYTFHFSRSNIRHLVKNDNFILVALSINTVLCSYDYGKSWEVINFSFGGLRSNSNSQLIYGIQIVGSNIFVYALNGFYYSTDYGKSWTKEVGDLEIFNMQSVSGRLYYNPFTNILYMTSSGGDLYELDLEKDLGITLSVERKNYLWHYPPFPQPSNNLVKIRTIWDSVIPFTEDDVEIYNLNGVKINTQGKLRIEMETKNTGFIVWENGSEQTGIYIVKTKHGTETRFNKIMITR